MSAPDGFVVVTGDPSTSIILREVAGISLTPAEVNSLLCEVPSLNAEHL